MRSSWLRVDPKLSGKYLYKRGHIKKKGRGHRHKGNGHVKMKPEIDPKPENTRSHQQWKEVRILPRAFSITDTLILDFWSLKLRENKFLFFFSHQS